MDCKSYAALRKEIQVQCNIKVGEIFKIIRRRWRKDHPCIVIRADSSDFSYRDLQALGRMFGSREIDICYDSGSQPGDPSELEIVIWNPKNERGL